MSELEVGVGRLDTNASLPCFEKKRDENGQDFG